MNLKYLKKLAVQLGARTDSDIQVMGKDIVDVFLTPEGKIQLVLPEEEARENIEAKNENTVYSRPTHKTETEERTYRVSEEESDDTI